MRGDQLSIRDDGYTNIRKERPAPHGGGAGRARRQSAYWTMSPAAEAGPSLVLAEATTQGTIGETMR